jgi:hypothetical protein
MHSVSTILHHAAAAAAITDGCVCLEACTADSGALQQCCPCTCIHQQLQQAFAYAQHTQASYHLCRYIYICTADLHAVRCVDVTSQQCCPCACIHQQLQQPFAHRPVARHMCCAAHAQGISSLLVTLAKASFRPAVHDTAYEVGYTADPPRCCSLSVWHTICVVVQICTVALRHSYTRLEFRCTMQAAGKSFAQVAVAAV